MGLTRRKRCCARAAGLDDPGFGIDAAEDYGVLTAPDGGAQPVPTEPGEWQRYYAGVVRGDRAPRTATGRSRRRSDRAAADGTGAAERRRRKNTPLYRLTMASAGCHVASSVLAGYSMLRVSAISREDGAEHDAIAARRDPPALVRAVPWGQQARVDGQRYLMACARLQGEPCEMRRTAWALPSLHPQHRSCATSLPATAPVFVTRNRTERLSPLRRTDRPSCANLV